YHVMERLYHLRTIRKIDFYPARRVFVDRNKCDLERNIPREKEICNAAQIFRVAAGAHIFNTNECPALDRVILTEYVVQKVGKYQRALYFSSIREYRIGKLPNQSETKLIMHVLI